MIKSISNKKIILGSNSPRRKELLTCLNLPFEVRTKKINENFPEDLSLELIASFIATKKSNSYNLNPNELLITSDTVVIHQNQILGKPKDKQHAFEMLRTLSNETHKVQTGVCIRTSEKLHCFSESTLVTFSKISNKEIEHYVQNYNPLDKAGAYGIQDWIGKIAVKKIDGCYYNVVGLPINKLYNELITF